MVLGKNIGLEGVNLRSEDQPPPCGKYEGIYEKYEEICKKYEGI